jgi:predicted protein tyrosine phosphatase
MVMGIYALSKKEAVDNIPNIDVPFTLISITGPESEGGEFAEIKNHKYMLDRLYLRLSDSNRQGWSETENSVFCDEETCRKIFEFCKKHENEIELIFVQCDAGVSRSAGLAAALSKYYLNTDDHFFTSYRFRPHMEIYSHVLSYFMENTGKPEIHSELKVCENCGKEKHCQCVVIKNHITKSPSLMWVCYNCSKEMETSSFQRGTYLS